MQKPITRCASTLGMMRRDQDRGSSECQPVEYIHRVDAILTLLNAIIYSGNPTAHVLSGCVYTRKLDVYTTKTAARKSTSTSVSGRVFANLHLGLIDDPAAAKYKCGQGNSALLSCTMDFSIQHVLSAYIQYTN